MLYIDIVDDEFQESVRGIFEIDNVTSEGIVPLDINTEGYETKTGDDKERGKGDGKIKYLRGPMKLMERARAKAQDKYADEDYPASACILDINRYYIH